MNSASSPDTVDRKIAAFRKKVDAAIRLAMLCPPGPEWIAKRALRYTLLTSGHRWRPVLFLALLESMKGPMQKYMATAVGLEILHSCTLIIDDLPFVDNAKIRRNKPTCHIRYGVDVAVYAGIAGLDIAEMLILDNAPEHLRETVRHSFTKLKMSLIESQCLEKALCGGSVKATARNIKKQYLLKCGAFFGFCTWLAALLCDSGPENVASLEKLGQDIGFAYQIADDIDDMMSKVENIGKNTNMDIGKVNYPRTFGLPFANRHCELHYNRATKALDRLIFKRVIVADTDVLLRIINRLDRKN